MAQLIHVGGLRDQPQVGDVVFVHGLDGHARATWTNRTGDFWPQWPSRSLLKMPGPVRTVGSATVPEAADGERADGRDRATGDQDRPGR
jgi:hypothetical protein